MGRTSLRERASNTVAVVRDPLGLLTRLSERGDVVPLEFLGDRQLLYLRSPADIERVLVTGNRRFPKRHPFLAEMKRLVGEGIATSEGDLWLRQRRLLQPAFSRERITGYTDALAEYAARTVDAWRPDEPRDLYLDFTKLVLAGTAQAFFSTQPGDDADGFLADVGVVMDHFGSPSFMFAPWLSKLPLPRMRRLHAAQARLDARIRGLIAARRDGGGPTHDLLAALLAARDDDGSPMPDQQVRDEVMTLYIAGYEPMSVALGWTFHLLGKHPDALARASEEARAALAGRVATCADLPRLPFVSAVIDESLRLFPPAWTSVREAAEDCELGGHPIAAGGYVWMSSWALHRDPRWYDAPLEFRPERWQDGLARRLPRCAYLPYGAGPRMCIGASLAALELPILAATILARWRLAPVEGREPRPLPSINLRPLGGIWLRPQPW